MTTLQQTCTEMLQAQSGLQQVAHAQRRAHAAPALNTLELSAAIKKWQQRYQADLSAAMAGMTRFAAANDNTMTVGVA